MISLQGQSLACTNSQSLLGASRGIKTGNGHETGARRWKDAAHRTVCLEGGHG